ncbi:MAG: DinB family protein [Chloroflexi bacterium]|nr:DinB family protein [Chloroflexota bacterium]
MAKTSQELQLELVATSRQIAERLQRLSEEDLKKPAPWHNTDFTVRFLLHRLAGHCLDHLNQLHKVRQGIGVAQSEAQMILNQYFVTQAAILGELVGLSEEQLAQPQAEGEWSANQVLEHLLTSQRNMLVSIEKALG